MSELDLFSKLGSGFDSEKVVAGVRITSAFNQKNSSEKKSVFKRIIRSLGATNPELRAGSFGVFTCLLHSLNDKDVTFEEIQDCIQIQLKPTGGTKNEDGEAHLGQLLAYKAMLLSNYLKTRRECVPLVANSIIANCSKRSYLHFSAFSLLTALIPETDMELVNDELITQLKDLDTFGLDKVLFMIALQDSFPKSRVFKEVFERKKFMSKNNVIQLASVLSKQQTSSTIYHPVFDKFSCKVVEAKLAPVFWENFCSGHQQYHPKNAAGAEMGIHVFSCLLKHMGKAAEYAADAESIFTDFIITAMLRGLKKISRAECNALSTHIQKVWVHISSEEKFRILRKMLISPGNWAFDFLTETSMVHSMVKNLDVDSIKLFASFCSEQVENEEVINKNKLKAFNYFCGALNSPLCTADVEWRLSGLESLYKWGFLRQSYINTELADLIRKSFFNNVSKRFSTVTDYAYVLKKLVTTMDKNLTQGNTRIKLKDEQMSTWRFAMKLINKIEQCSVQNLLISGIKILTFHMTLMIINDPKDSAINIKDVASVFNDVVSGKSPKEGRPEWIEVFMDLLLNLLSKPSSSHRNVIGCVFKACVPHLTLPAFTQLIKVLDPNYDLKSPEADEEQSETDDKSESEESGSEASTHNGDEQSASDEEADDDDEPDEADTDSEDESDKGSDDDEPGSEAKVARLQKLQSDLRSALTAVDSDNDSIDVDMLDEETGKRINNSLAQVFARSLNRKVKRRKRESELVPFRARILDLVETNAKVGMPFDHWLILIPTLVKLSRNLVGKKEEASLLKRLLQTFNSFASVKMNFEGVDNFSSSQLTNLCQDMLDQLQASDISLELKSGYINLTKLLFRNAIHFFESHKTESNEHLQHMVLAAATRYFSLDRHHVPLEFFIYLCNINWDGLHEMMGDIAELTFSAGCKAQKKMTGLTLLAAYFSNQRFFLNPTKVLTKKLERICSALVAAILKVKNLDNKTALAILNLLLVIRKSKANDLVKWESLSSAARYSIKSIDSTKLKKKQLRTLELMVSQLNLDRKLLTSMNRLSEKMNVPEKSPVVPPSEPSIEENGCNDQTPPVILSGKKKRKEDVRKLKKESKRLRLEAMGDLDCGSFSVLADDSDL